MKYIFIRLCEKRDYIVDLKEVYATPLNSKFRVYFSEYGEFITVVLKEDINNEWVDRKSIEIDLRGFDRRYNSILYFERELKKFLSDIEKYYFLTDTYIKQRDFLLKIISQGLDCEIEENQKDLVVRVYKLAIRNTLSL